MNDIHNDIHVETSWRRTIASALAGGVLVTGGASVAYLLIRTKPVAEMRTSFAQVADVDVEVAHTTDFDVPITTFGTVRAKAQLAIIPQVSGQLVYANKHLAQGMIIPKGELLFEIDRTIYEARVRQAEAEVKGFESELGRHDQEITNLDRRIQTAEAVLAIDENDYSMSKSLFEKDKVGTQRSLDLAYQRFLRQKDAVVQLKNSRAMVPHLKLATKAQLDAARARVDQAKHNLESTRIFCPFRARVEAVSAGESQVVAAHLSIATLTNMEALEISVGVDPRDLRWLVEEITPAALGEIDSENRPTVLVRWSVEGAQHTWHGSVTRFERMDEATRTARLVVEVRNLELAGQVAMDDNGSTQAMLSIGMYCRVDLPTRRLADALVIPRHAIYQDKWVYVFEPDGSGDGTTGKISRRHVSILRATGDTVLVDYRGCQDTQPCGLKSGERLIVSTLARPTVGMKVVAHGQAMARTNTQQKHDPASNFSAVLLASTHDTNRS